MTLLADVRSAWRYDSRRYIRLIFIAGQTAAALGGDRTDCPHKGNLKPTRNTRKRSILSQARLRDSRLAWLAGFDGQKEAMKDGLGITEPA